MYANLLSVAIFCNCISSIFGHGYLLEPLSRNSLSLKFKVANPNYNRNGLNCGGASHQWNVCNGKCGVCGDPFDTIKKAHEPGGFYFDGRIVNTYKAGQMIDASVRITSHHKGFFKFRVAKASPEGRVTQQQLEQHLLRVEKADGTFSNQYDLPNEGNKKYYMKLKLPDGFTCTRCVFQWFYTTGNNWRCPTCSVASAKPESFVNCADIKIIDGNENGSNKVNGSNGSGNNGSGSGGNSNQGNGNNGSSNQGSGNQGSGNQGSSNQGSGNQGSGNGGNGSNGSGNQGGSSGGNGSQGNGNQGSGNGGNGNKGSGNQGGNKTENKIPKKKKTCKGVAGFDKSKKMAEWCTTSCNHVPPQCPETLCTCFT